MYDRTHQNTEPLAVLHTALEPVRQPVFIVDARTKRVVYANPAGCQALEAARSDLIGRLLSNAGKTFQKREVRDIRIGGRRCVVIACEPVRDESEVSSIACDALTGLPNREALYTRVSWSNASTKPLALLFIDLDGFKLINDTWGHLAGDHVLRVVAERISGSVRPRDLVVRFGGDEFIVIAEGIQRRRDVVRCSRRIARTLQRPILVEGQEVTISASIGVAQRGRNTPNIDALIAVADRAMYRAKALVQIHCTTYGEHLAVRHATERRWSAR